MKTLLQVWAVLLLVACSSTRAWRDSIQNTVVCNLFHVAHASSVEAASHAVSVTLWNDDGQVECFEPREAYTVRLTSHFHDIKGFLWKLNNSRGTFPIVKREYDKYVYGICEKSISHRCERYPCNYNRDLSFEVMTPKSRRLPLAFRYTVVFSAQLHLENKVAEFPPCRQQGTPGATTATSPLELTTDPVPTIALDVCGNPVVNSSSEEEVGEEEEEGGLIDNNTSLDNEGGPARESPFTTLPRYLTEVNSNCGLNKVIVNESRYFEKNGIEYFCTLKSTKPIKNIHCEPSCLRNGSVLFCEVKNSLSRKKGFVCHAMSSSVPEDLAYIEEQFIVTVTNQCVCGVCPTSSQ